MIGELGQALRVGVRRRDIRVAEDLEALAIVGLIGCVEPTAFVTVSIGLDHEIPASVSTISVFVVDLTRDTIVTASNMLLDALPDIRLQSGAQPELRCLRLGEMHTCWHLPARFTPRS